MTTPPTYPEAAEASRLRLVRALLDVFGEDGTRNENQELVWAYLRQVSYQDRPSFLPDGNGAFCPIRAAVTDGRRGLFLELSAILSEGIAATEKPTVTK